MARDVLLREMGPCRNFGWHEAMGEERVIIFDIQRFSLHDGPGVRTTVFFKGCPLRCRWCQNPESHSSVPEMAFYRNRCVECGSCGTVCSRGAVRFPGEERLLYENCSACGECVEACPSGALKLIGRSMSSEELFRELLRDRDFFDDSGGGVTFSGGEPFLYPDFVFQVGEMLRREGIGTLAETCGFFNSRLVIPIQRTLDSVFFDLKHAVSARHRELTGQGNEIIHQNFFALASGGMALQPRMPVVPGFNDDEENIGLTAELIHRAGLSRVHLLPYHRLGEGKLDCLNTAVQRPGIAAPTEQEMDRVSGLFRERGIETVLYR